MDLIYFFLDITWVEAIFILFFLSVILIAPIYTRLIGAIGKLKKEQIYFLGLFSLVLMLISNIFNIDILWGISLCFLIIISLALIKKDKNYKE
ncbi:hypothetical protein KZ072_001451 [Campylobacter coli]|nr:hypothetical protein [Campylobacter coli]